MGQPKYLRRGTSYVDSFRARITEFIGINKFTTRSEFSLRSKGTDYSCIVINVFQLL